MVGRWDCRIYVVWPTHSVALNSSCRPVFIALCYHTCKYKQTKGYEGNSENPSPTNQTVMSGKLNYFCLKTHMFGCEPKLLKRPRPHSMRCTWGIFWAFWGSVLDWIPTKAGLETTDLNVLRDESKKAPTGKRACETWKNKKHTVHIHELPLWPPGDWLDHISE